MRERGGDRKFFFALEGIRGVAALVVLAYHYILGLDAATETSHPLLHAYLAVDLFFVLSGFIIAHAYERSLLAGMGFWQFALRRIVRLWPLLLASASLALSVPLLQSFLVTPHHARLRYLSSFVFGSLFLPTPAALSPLREWAFPANIPAWSLSVEMGANLAYATLVGMLTARRLGFVAAVSAAALTVVALSFGSFNLGGAWSGYGGGWLRVCWGFTAGILVYRFCLRHPPKQLPTAVLYALGLGFVGLSAIRSEGVALDLGAVLIAFPLAVYFGAGVELSGVSKRLASRLGHLSYPVYITHSPILDVLLKPLAGKLGFRMGSHPNTAVVVCGLLAVAAAWALDVFFDRPVRAWLTRRLTSHESRLSPSVDSGSPA